MGTSNHFNQSQYPCTRRWLTTEITQSWTTEMHTEEGQSFQALTRLGHVCGWSNVDRLIWYPSTDVNEIFTETECQHTSFWSHQLLSSLIVYRWWSKWCFRIFAAETNLHLTEQQFVDAPKLFLKLLDSSILCLGCAVTMMKSVWNLLTKCYGHHVINTIWNNMAVKMQ